MQGTNNIPLNRDSYEQLKQSCENIKFEEFNIDIDKNLEEYVESLEHIDGHEREIELEEHIDNTITPSILQWQRKYAGNNTLLQNIRTQINNLKNYRSNLKVEIKNLKRANNDKHDEIDLKKAQIDEAEHNLLDGQKIDLKYEWKKAFIFIMFSVVVAFATYIYFLDNQVNLKWSSKTTEDRAKAIETLITEYHDEGYINYIARTQDGCFEKYKDDNGRLNKKELFANLDYVDLSCIEPNLLGDAPKPSLESVFTINKKLLVLAFSAFLLMMVGKIIAVFYEKMGYKNWIFYLFSGLAVVILITTIYVNSALSSLDIEKSQVDKQISSLESKIIKIKKSYTNGMEFDEDEPEKWKTFTTTIEAQKAQKVQKHKLPILEKEISSYSFWVSLLVMLSELVIGAVAWMTYADYIKKKTEVEISGGGYVERLKEEKKNLEDLIKENKEQIIEKEENDAKAQDLSASLTTLLGSIHTNEEITEMVESYKKSISAKGKAILKSAEARWHKGSKSC